MTNEDSSDLFGNFVEEVEFHECGSDVQEKHNLDLEDRERMSNLVAKDSHLSERKAKALVNRYF